MAVTNRLFPRAGRVDRVEWQGDLDELFRRHDGMGCIRVHTIFHRENPLSAIRERGYDCSMTSLLEIKAAIDRLSPQEYCELMAMLHPAVDDDWDRHIAADVAAGRLDALIAEARADIEAGRTVPLETVLDEDERSEGRP